MNCWFTRKGSCRIGTTAVRAETCMFSVVVGRWFCTSPTVAPSPTIGHQSVSFFPAIAFFDSHNQLGSSTKHLFQLGDFKSPSGPREVEVELKSLSQTHCGFCDLFCDTTVVRFCVRGDTLREWNVCNQLDRRRVALLPCFNFCLW